MAATRHAFGTGPHGQHGAPPTSAPRPTSGPQSSAQGTYRSQPEEPHPHPLQPHPRPFFFVQPSQPFYPYQWPMPMPYNPYCGFPGLGYGMVMPPFQPNPYMEAPGYIVPQAQLHLADYRRMVNPHFPPTVAYHARRFRYQQNGAPRETANSEVQTEPPPLSRSGSRDSDPCPGSDPLVGSDSGRGSSCANASAHSQSTCCEKPGRLNPEATPPPVPATPMGGYTCRSEEVRIECEASPAGLKIIRSHETTAESLSVAAAAPGGDLVRCDVWSVSSAEGVIPLYRSSAHEGDAVSRDPSCPAPEEQCVASYPDILLMGGSPSRGEDLPTPPRECATLTGPPAAGPAGGAVTPACGASESLGDAERDHEGPVDDCPANPAKNVHFKILRLPFEMQYLDDLRNLEESVWSVESLMPYVPSAEWMIQQGFMQPEKIAAEVPVETSASQSEAAPALEISQEVAVVQGGGQRESVSSVDSLPPYLPSASWLADFGNVYYYSKLPLHVQEQLSIMGNPADPLVARKKSEKKSSGQRAVAVPAAPKKREEKHRRAPKLERRERGRSALVPGDEGPQNCAGCLNRRNVPASLKPAAGPTVKRHRVSPPPPPSPGGSPTGQTCLACGFCGARPVRKRRGPEVPVRNTEEGEVEDEAVENRAHPAAPKQPGGGERGRAGVPAAEDDGGRRPAPSRRHVESCSAAQCSKLRELNCSCEEPQRGPSRDAPRRGHTDAAKDGGEISAPAAPVTERLKTVEQRCLTQKLQTERSWRATMAVHDRDSCENGSRQRNVNKPKKVLAQMQERQQCKMSNKTIAQRPLNPDFVEPIEGYYTRSSWTKGTHRRDTRY
ncbi:uncharacterized protein buc2l [Anguilla rostrata]|uniref:uncharacterized protein buc2l n=1 Tax=Anguilla rostrata TaxID=7938 RepID=UPI0030D61016